MVVGVNGCATCRGDVLDGHGWAFDIVTPFEWPMPIGEPVRMSGHLVMCAPCAGLVTAGRIGDLVRRSRGGKPTSTATSDAIAMTLALVDHLGPPVRLADWAARQPPSPDVGNARACGCTDTDMCPQHFQTLNPSQQAARRRAARDRT